MTKRERDIIARHYEMYLRNGDDGNPIGGFADMEEMFIELERESAELHETLQGIFYESSLTRPVHSLSLN